MSIVDDDTDTWVVAPTNRSTVGDRTFPVACLESVERLAFLSQSRFVTVDVSSGTEDLSLPVEFPVT